MSKEIRGYLVKNPGGGTSGQMGGDESHPAMSAEVAKKYLKREAKRLKLDEKDFSLIEITSSVMSHVWIELLSGKVIKQEI